MPHLHVEDNGKPNITLRLRIPGHGTELVADVRTDERLTVMLDADGEVLDNTSLALAVNDNINATTIHGPHSGIVEVGIIRTTSNTILDIVDSCDVDSGVFYDTGTTFRLCVNLIGSFSCVGIVCGNNKQVAALPDCDSGMYAVTAIFIVLSAQRPKTANDIADIINSNYINIAGEINAV